VPSFIQAKDKMFPQSGHKESVIPLYVTVQLIKQHMHLHFLASIHLNQTAILQMQAVCSSQTLQQTVATECKNKEKEKTHLKNSHDGSLKP